MASRRMIATFALASAVFAASAPSAPLLAAGSSPYYRAELAAPAGEAKVVASGVLWSCAGNTCLAGKHSSRALTVCLKLKRATTDVVQFSVDGKGLSAEDLARCNA